MPLLLEPSRPGVLGAENDRLDRMAVPTLEHVGRAVAAFLNGNGGSLLLGVDGSGQVLGVENAPAFREALQDHLAQALSPPASVSVTLEEIDGKTCLDVDVPPGSERPYIYDNRIFLRSGGSVHVAAPEELSALILRRTQEPVRWERLPALGAEAADLDRAEIQKTVREAQERRYLLSDDASDADPMPVLEQLSLCEGGLLRNSAVILFGREPARRYPQVRVRAAHLAGQDGSELLEDQVFEGNIFSLLSRAEQFLRRVIPASSRLPATGLARQETPAYPWAAVREALVNALVHRDYAAYDGSVSLTLFPDRLEFWNPGTLPEGWTPQDLRAGQISRPHNPDIAHVFFLRGLVERLGSGGPRIVQACANAGLPEPEWALRGGGVSLTFRQATRMPTRPPDASAVAWTAPLPTRAQSFLRRTTEGEHFTRQEYQRGYAPEVSERTVRNDLARMTEQGFLVPVGQGPVTAYVRTDKAAG